MKAEPFDRLFTNLGITLTFTGFTIQGVPFFEQVTLYGEPTVAKMESRVFNFIVKTSDAKTNSLAKGNIFSITEGSYVYEFDIDDLVPDMTGITELRCSFRSKT